MELIKKSFSKFFDKLSDNYEKYLTIYMCINVAWIFLGIFFYNYHFLSFNYQKYSTSYILFLIINIIFIIISYCIKKVKFDKKDIFMFLLIIFGFISVICAKDVSMALYGTWRRFEGFFQLLYYYSLLYLSSFVFNEKCKKWIINFILFFGLINVFICFLQVFDILKFININLRGTSLGQGLTTNSNFFGSYMILCTGISLGMYSFNDKIKSKVFYYVLTLCFYAGLLMSSAFSSMLGLFVILLFLFFHFIYICVKKMNILKSIINYVILFLGLFFVSLFLTLSNKTMMFSDIIQFSNETREVAKGNVDDSYGSARFFIWKNTLGVVPKNLIHGVGVDNFLNAFGDYPLHSDVVDNMFTYYDKAHNEYLQKLICEGIFSCLSYLILLFILFITNLKRIFKDANYVLAGLFFGFIGYCVQAFFNISVIEVAPLFWITLGLLYNRLCKK